MRSTRIAALVLVASSSVHAAAPAPTAPPRVVESFGVCPFECCTYREWTADAAIPVHQTRDDNSTVLFTLEPGQKVKAVTGVVVTEKPMAITIDHDLRDGYLDGKTSAQLSLRKGDVIYALSPLGEGAYQFWYRGKVYRSGEALGAMPDNAATGSDLSWWKQVKLQSGKSGWTRSEKFSGADACS